MRTGAACRCSAKRICTNFVSSEPLVLFSAFNISANLRSAALTNALRCRRIVSVCVFKRAKRGRFAYFSLKLALIRLTPAPPGTGDPFLFLRTGAEAPAYFRSASPRRGRFYSYPPRVPCTSRVRVKRSKTSLSTYEPLVQSTCVFSGRAGLKIQYWQQCVGSIPSVGKRSESTIYEGRIACQLIGRKRF